MSWADNLPDDIRNRELEHINKRRRIFGQATVNPAKDDRIGLALSGGGIRSATFALGVLRGLSRLRILPKIDYLSTVSGGSYIGAFYGSLFVGRAGQPPMVEQPQDSAADLLRTAQPSVDWLRQSGRYLTPAGARDYIYGFSVTCRHWLATQTVLGFALLLLGLILNWFWIHSLEQMNLATQTSAGWPYFGILHWLRFHFKPWLSPLLFLSILLLGMALALCWAFWLPTGWVGKLYRQLPWFGTAALAIGAGYCLRFQDVRIGWVPLVSLGLIFPTLALVLWWGAFIKHWWDRRCKSTEEHKLTASEIMMQQNEVRTILTRWLSHVILLTLIGAGVGGLHTLGWLVWTHQLITMRLFFPVAGGSIVLVLVPVARWLLSHLDWRRAMGRIVKTWRVAVFLVAIILALVVTSLWFALAHKLTWDSRSPSGQPSDPSVTLARSVDLIMPETAASMDIGAPAGGRVPDRQQWYGPAPDQADWHMFWPAIIIVFLFCLVIGPIRRFLNLSSMANFYAARLRRAYLGATNMGRIAPKQGMGEPTHVTDVHPADDIRLADYYRALGGPAHLINITINETRSRGPNTIQRDRKGRNLVISPAGLLYPDTASVRPGRSVVDAISLSETDPEWRALCQEEIVKSAGEDLPLSTWVGISGAAFSTGLGSRTSLSLSLLAGLANIRLGYWWQAKPAKVSWPPVQWLLAREFLANFPGIDGCEWYLSDGGHFENTGAYELIRRQVPFIIVSDAAADPNYIFNDVANLVRKARIDFGADIHFLDDHGLDQKLGVHHPLRRRFASLPAFVDKACRKAAFAALATISYQGNGQGTLLLIKPCLTDDAPLDLLRYAQNDADFPQQTTLDQFFDETQWESYYVLGQRLAEEMFREPDEQRSSLLFGRKTKWWWPANLMP